MAAHVCPPWIGFLLASPIRKLVQSPDRILGPYVEPGMTVIDVGCAMGFFSLPMARMVGPDGRVVCTDVQERMIRSLTRRAEKAGLAERIEPRLANGSLGAEDLRGRIDFALAFAVVHETDDPAALMCDLFAALSPGGRLLIAEPGGHVSQGQFETTIQQAIEAGFSLAERPAVPRSHAALMVKGDIMR